MNVLLLLLLAIPLGGAVLLKVFRTSMVARTSRWIALGATLASLCMSLGLVNQFRELPLPQSSANRPIEPRYEVRYHWLTLTDAGRTLHERCAAAVEATSAPSRSTSSNTWLTPPPGCFTAATTASTIKEPI